MPNPLIHEAFFYASDAEFVARVAPFLGEAVAAGEGAIAVTTEARIERLRRKLGSRADAVSFFDASEWYARPGATLVAWRELLDRRSHDGMESVRVVGEVQFADRDDEQLERWMRYESLLNRSLAERRAWLLCPYNTQAVPDTILSRARETHPFVSTVSRRETSAEHLHARELGALFAPVEDSVHVDEHSHTTLARPSDIGLLRRLVRWQAQSASLPPDVIDDLLLAAREVVLGALARSVASVSVRTARRGGEWLCEIQCSAPVAGTALPLREDDLGLLIGRLVCDRVEVADDQNGLLARFIFGKPRADPRQRILAAASDLFRADGIRSTGINAVIARADVAKATFYAHFQSKDELIRVWLDSPAVRWFDNVCAEVEARAQSPVERLTGFFEVLSEWLAEDGFRGCHLINAAAEFHGSDEATRQALADRNAAVEEYFRRTAGAAGVADPDGLAGQLATLVSGAIVLATASASAEPAATARDASAQLVAAATASLVRPEAITPPASAGCADDFGGLAN
jgi:AcrR family transcriptional regulator